MKTNFLEKLNIEQKKAVSFKNQPLLILAGAGSGKTRVLTYRAAWLVLEKGIDPQDILLVTFTNKAAAEMKGRISKLLTINNPSSGSGNSTITSAVPACRQAGSKPDPSAGRQIPGKKSWKLEACLAGRQAGSWQPNIEELSVLRTLYKFPEMVEQAGKQNAPNQICNYLYDLAQKYNSFYGKNRILQLSDTSKSNFRLMLTAATGQILKNGLGLLGIEVVEKM